MISSCLNGTTDHRNAVVFRNCKRCSSALWSDSSAVRILCSGFQSVTKYTEFQKIRTRTGDLLCGTISETQIPGVLKVIFSNSEFLTAINFFGFQLLYFQQLATLGTLACVSSVCTQFEFWL